MQRTPKAVSVQQAREALRAADLRSTASRVAVYQYVAGARKPLSHADVSEALVPEGYDKSTLYRCLVELADAGLLARLDAGDHAWRFELKVGEEEHGTEHPHFVCVDCGKVTCLTDVEVKISPPKKASPVGDVTEIFLKGHCKECV